MPLFTNIIITGQPQTGKSPLATWLLEQLDAPYAGLLTTKLSDSSAGAFQLQNVLTKESTPILTCPKDNTSSLACTEDSTSAFTCTEDTASALAAAFDSFGVRTLKQALASIAPIILVDEIGSLEQNSPAFLTELFAALDSDKTVIAVLKKEDLPYLAQIKARADALLIDLDLTSPEAARKLLTKVLITEALL